MDAARISVVIPCYNLGRYLDEAVDSVLAQTCQDFEILVVDDGSTDVETCALLADYRRPRTRVVRSENQGLPAAKNLGIAHTSGPYLCMLDADDRLEPQMLAKSLTVLDNDPSIAFVSHWLRAYGDETWEWTPTRCDFPTLLDTNTVNGAALVRREALAAAGGFDESMRRGCEDWDLWISVVERGLKGIILPEFLFHYRRRQRSMSRLMHENHGHPALYRGLVEKHSETYQRYVLDLVLRRERDIARLRRHQTDLEFEQSSWLAPDLAVRRNDVVVLERKVEEEQRRRDERSGLERSLNEARSALAAAARREYELDARVHRAESALEDVRRSLSWRVTAPLRAVYAVCRRALGLPA